MCRRSANPGGEAFGVQFYNIISDTVLGVLLELRVPFDRTIVKTLAASLFAKSKVISAKKTMYIISNQEFIVYLIWFFERLDICSFEANRWVNYVR